MAEIITKNVFDAINLARDKDDFSRLEQIYKHMNINVLLYDNDINPPSPGFLLACKIGNVKICQFFVERGADVDYVSPFKEIGIRIAAEYEHWDICNYLVDKVTVFEEGILHLAVKAEESELCRKLIKKGANLNYCLAMVSLGPKYNPLIWWAKSSSCSQGHFKTLMVLLEGGIDPNSTDEWGNTALMLIAKKGSTRAVYNLLAFGADPNAKENINGKTVVEIYDEAEQTVKGYFPKESLNPGLLLNDANIRMFIARMDDFAKCHRLLTAKWKPNFSKS